MGQWGDHNHRDRIIDSKVVSSEQLADLYLIYKDHKRWGKSRPVVTGCNSNTRGFSNCVSDLLESVNKANQTPYEAISGEDLLARVEKFNQEAEELKHKGREKLLRKMMCGKRDGHTIIAKCGKLWMKKRLAIKDEMDEGIEEDECLEEDGSEMMTTRRESYREEPGMKLTGEDNRMVMDCD